MVQSVVTAINSSHVTPSNVNIIGVSAAASNAAVSIRRLGAQTQQTIIDYTVTVDANLFQQSIATVTTELQDALTNSVNSDTFTRIIRAVARNMTAPSMYSAYSVPGSLSFPSAAFPTIAPTESPTFISAAGVLKKHFTAIIVTVVVVVFILAAAGYYFLFYRNSASNDKVVFDTASAENSAMEMKASTNNPIYIERVSSL